MLRIFCMICDSLYLLHHAVVIMCIWEETRLVLIFYEGAHVFQIYDLETLIVAVQKLFTKLDLGIWRVTIYFYAG